MAGLEACLEGEGEAGGVGADADTEVEHLLVEGQVDEKFHVVEVDGLVKGWVLVVVDTWAFRRVGVGQGGGSQGGNIG
jgi:hypothetical protein